MMLGALIGFSSNGKKEMSFQIKAQKPQHFMLCYIKSFGLSTREERMRNIMFKRNCMCFQELSKEKQNLKSYFINFKFHLKLFASLFFNFCFPVSPLLKEQYKKGTKLPH